MNISATLSPTTSVARHDKQLIGRGGGGGGREVGDVFGRFWFLPWKRLEEDERGRTAKGEAGDAAFLRSLQFSTYERAMLVMEVTDAGIGIAPARMDRLFKPFWQVRRPGIQNKGSTRSQHCGV